MKTKKMFVMIVILTILILPCNLLAEWKEIGPCGGWITCMKSLPQNPQKMFCGVLQGGAYVSDDRGEHWHLIPEIGEYNPVYDLSLLPDGTMYLASQNGLFISRNSGTSWRKILNTSTWQVFALKNTFVAADTAKGTESWVKYMHPTNSPWLISYDYGQHWQFWQGTVDSSISWSYYLLPHQKRGNMIITANNQIFRVEGLRIFKTINDNWTEWQYINDLDPSFYQLCPAFLFTTDSGSTCYAFTEYHDFHPGGYFLGGVFKSDDSWQSWTRVTTTISVTALTAKGFHLFIGESGGETYNSNSKLILYRTNENSTEELGIFGGDIIAIDAENWEWGELVVAAESGIYKTSDSGKIWYSSSSGIHRVNAVAAQTIPSGNNSEQIILAVHKGGFWSSENDGSTWVCEDLSPYILPGLLQTAANYPQYLYAGGFEILRSSNYGKSWNALPDYYFPAAYYGWYGRAVDIAVDPNRPEHAIVHYYDHSLDDYRGIICAETLDYGDSWTERFWFGGQYDFSWKAAFDPHNNRLWISNLGGYYNNIAIPAFMVIDSTWENPCRSITLPDSVVATFWCVHGDTCFVINTTTAKFFRSEDLGITWFVNDLGDLQYNRYWQDWAVFEPLGQLTISSDTRYLFFVYPGTGVLFSEDKGETWKILNDGLPTLNTYHLTFSSLNQHIAYLATDNGFYKMDFISSVKWKKDENNPSGSTTNHQDYILCNNFPNPFNSITTIYYQMKQSGKITLSIYNLLGHEVETLIDHQIINPGNHSIQWDASNYSNGVYLIRLRSEHVIMVRKALLLK